MWPNKVITTCSKGHHEGLSGRPLSPYHEAFEEPALCGKAIYWAHNIQNFTDERAFVGSDLRVHGHTAVMGRSKMVPLANWTLVSATSGAYIAVTFIYITFPCPLALNSFYLLFRSTFIYYLGTNVRSFMAFQDPRPLLWADYSITSTSVLVLSLEQPDVRSNKPYVISKDFHFWRKMSIHPQTKGQCYPSPWNQTTMRWICEPKYLLLSFLGIRGNDHRLKSNKNKNSFLLFK